MTLRIVAIGGTVNPASTTEMAMRYACRPLSEAGARVDVFGGEYIDALPNYRGKEYREDHGKELVEAVRVADGVIIAAPGYHGTVSGVVKNALDYLEDLAKDRRPYLDGRAVGLVATAYGDQAAMGTLLTLRSIIHALRGWPTPMGVTARTYQGMFSPEGECLDDRIRMQLTLVGQQVLQGASAWSKAGPV